MNLSYQNIAPWVERSGDAQLQNLMKVFTVAGDFNRDYNREFIFGGKYHGYTINEFCRGINLNHIQNYSAENFASIVSELADGCGLEYAINVVNNGLFNVISRDDKSTAIRLLRYYCKDFIIGCYEVELDEIAGYGLGDKSLKIRCDYEEQRRDLIQFCLANGIKLQEVEN